MENAGKKTKSMSAIHFVEEDLQFSNRFERLSDTEECQQSDTDSEVPEEIHVPRKRKNSKTKKAAKRKISKNEAANKPLRSPPLSESDISSSDACISPNEESQNKLQPPSKKMKLNTRTML